MASRSKQSSLSKVKISDGPLSTRPPVHSRSRVGTARISAVRVSDSTICTRKSPLYARSKQRVLEGFRWATEEDLIPEILVGSQGSAQCGSRQTTQRIESYCCSPRSRFNNEFDRAQQRLASETIEHESVCASKSRLRLSKPARARNPYAHLVADVDEFVRQRLARQVSFSERLELIDELGHIVYASSESSSSEKYLSNSQSESVTSEKLSTLRQRRNTSPTFLREIQTVGGED